LPHVEIGFTHYWGLALLEVILEGNTVGTIKEGVDTGDDPHREKVGDTPGNGAKSNKTPKRVTTERAARGEPPQQKFWWRCAQTQHEV